MAEKSTGIKFRVSALNTTGRVFKQIADSAAGVGKNLAKWFVAGAGFSLGQRAIKSFASTVKELGDLSDVAQAAGTTTDEITKLSTALNTLGVKGSKPEELAATFQRMVKTTGQVGTEGFFNVVEEISKLPTVQDRATAAMQAFGKSGLQFLPIIKGAAANGIENIKTLAAGMPGISQAAADAGDSVAAAMTIMWAGIKSIFAEGVGKIAQMIDSGFTGGVRQAAMIGAVQMKYFAGVGFRYVSTFFKNFRQVAIDTFQWFSKILDNSMKAFGGLIVTAAENMATRTKGVLDDIGTGAAALMARLRGDKESEQRILDMAYYSGKARDKEIQDNWDQYEKLMKSLDWKYEGIMANVNTDDLAAQRDAAIETVKKAGEAYGKAAAKVGAVDLAKIGGQQAAGRRADTTNPEAVMGGSYKALTYALRQGYATGMAEVKNLLKKTVDGLKGVKKAVEDNHLDLGLA